MGYKVAVIMGGTSFEREFSLKSGERIASELEARGHEVLPLDATDDLVATLRAERPDAAVIAMHGLGGEDGTMAELLEYLEIPFVGSPSDTCRACWNKVDLPRAFDACFAGDTQVEFPRGYCLTELAFRTMGAAGALDLAGERLGFPLCVKPACGGSAMGVSRVDAPEQLGDAVMGALAYDDKVVVQEWVEGVELAVSVVVDDGEAVVLPAVEIAPKRGFFDTEARLDEAMVDYYCPPRAASLGADEKAVADVEERVAHAALAVFEALGCRDLARVDMIVHDGVVYVTDAKVAPGMTRSSLLPMSAKAAGADVGEILDALVQTAVERGC